MDAAIKSEPAALHSTLRYKFIALVGPDHVRPAGAADTVAGVQAKLIIAPGTEKEVAEVLRLSNEAGLSVIPRGGGTKLAWGNPPSRADLILSTARLNEIIEHAWADLTVTVESGCTIQRLQETLAQHGQRLALDPLWTEKATVGGVISTNDSGSLRLRFGALRDLIIGVTIALPDGTLASSGGKVVKNVAGYDLPKLVTGALGTLGVITRAVFRLHPLPRNSRSFSISATEPEGIQQLILTIQDSKLAHTALQARFARDDAPATDILFEGTDAGLTAQEAQLKKLAGAAKITEVSQEIWNARQELWSFSDAEKTTVAKLSILPADLAKMIATLDKITGGHQLQWKAIVQATGISWLKLEGTPEALHPALQELRDALEHSSGSLFVAHQPKSMPSLDAWGTAGDALPLMKAVKHELDAKSTLNPGRFVGKI
jgi:glycolate dehydrogenase FAD-binding subunit